MSDGRVPFDTVRLPKDTARMIDHLVDAAGMWATAVACDAESENERERYRELCYARKWLSEHVEDLCQAAGVQRCDEDQLLRFL